MATLDTDIRAMRGVGEARAKALQKLGITDLESLISYFPRDYEDRTDIKKIAELAPGEAACFAAVVAETPRAAHIRRGLDLLKFRAVDGASAVDITYFNQNYLKEAFHPGESYVFYGRVPF